MNDVTLSASRRLGLRKPLEQVRAETHAHQFRRMLGPVHLVLLGVGCIIGSGIFVLTGNAAAHFAGPAVLISFLLAGLACTFSGLCYAELASSMPVAGSAYTYAYTTLGEVGAWITGWLMMFEYGIAAAMVAVGFSGYVTSVLHDLGVVIPAQLSTPYIDTIVAAQGSHVFSAGHGMNLVAAAGVLLATFALLFGVALSATVNGIMVVIKVAVLLTFVAVGVWWVEPRNWTPFIPSNQGGFTYGVPGILRAASVIFFAYVGFEAVSTAGMESSRPQRDLPIGILGALGICTLIYLAVAAVMTGLVPFTQLGVPDPLAVAVNTIGASWFGLFIKLGAVVGLQSVMLTTLYGQTRVFHAMASDGLLPPAFSKLHARWRTPRFGTLIVGLSMAAAAALLPISILSDIVSLGCGLSFGIVCLTVMWLRSREPALPRPFKVPGGGVWIRGLWLGVVPSLGIAFCFLMVMPLILDISSKAFHHNPIPALLLGGYCVMGAIVYLVYGRHHSKLRNAQD